MHQQNKKESSMMRITKALVMSVAYIASVAHADTIVPAIPGATITSVQPTAGTNNQAAISGHPENEDEESIEPVKKHDSDMFSMQKRLDELEQRSRVAEAIGDATQKPSKANFVGADTVYDYREGGVYKVYAGVDDITDIALQPGETLTSEPVSGDTVRWVMATTKSGMAPNEVVHVILKPQYNKITTTVIIPTNKHVYKLRVISAANWHMPGVRWNYPQEEAQRISIAAASAKKTEMQTQPTSVSPDKLDFNYQVTGDNVVWKPLQVFDDGLKTYLKMPPAMVANEAPALFVVDEDDNTMLVNYRLKDGVYVVDRLFKKAVLKVGLREEVQIVYKSSSKGFWQTTQYPRSMK